MVGFPEVAVIMVAAVALPALVIAILGYLLWKGAKRPERFAARTSDPELIQMPPLHTGPVGRWCARVLTGPGAGVSGIVEVSGGELAFIPEGSRQPVWAVPAAGLKLRWPGAEFAVGRATRDAYSVSARQRVRLYVDLPTVGEIGLIVSHVPVGRTWNSLTERDENRAVSALAAQLRELGAEGPSSGMHLV